jgi:hypothetical protein
MFEELNSVQLYKILSKDSCTKKKFIGVLARDQLPYKPKYPSCFIINTDRSNKPGAHWLAFYYDNVGHCTFFDSFGIHPSFYRLTSYLERTSKSWNYNNIKFQSNNSKTCGYYAFIFILLKCRGIDLKNIDLKAKDLNFFNINLF